MASHGGAQPGHGHAQVEALNPGMAMRLGGYLERAAQDRKHSASLVLLANLDQNPDCMAMMGKHVPTLLRRSHIFMIKGHQVEQTGVIVPMTPNEHLAVMGWPMYGAAAQQCTLRSTLGRISDDSKRSLAGNGMHIGVAGAVLLYALCSVSCERGVEERAGGSSSGAETLTMGRPPQG